MTKQELQKQAKKKQQEYQDLIRQIKELDRKVQTVVIRSLSKDDKLKYITNGTLNNTIKNMDPNTWNEPVYYDNSYGLSDHHSTLPNIGYGHWAPFYNMQDNIEQNSRLSGSMNGYQINDHCIQAYWPNDWNRNGAHILYYNNKITTYIRPQYCYTGVCCSRNVFLYKE